MADITMCHDDNCPSRVVCYRYRARASTHQSYFADTGRDGRSRCDHFATTSGYSDKYLTPMDRLDERKERREGKA